MINDFLRSIGFLNLKNNKELFELLEKVINNSDEQIITRDQYGNRVGSFSREFGENFGIVVCGDFLDNNEYHIEYYYPYFRGSDITTTEAVELERFARREAYAGICDEMRLGCTLIFTVDNVGELLKQRELNGSQYKIHSVTLSGLASNGKILLPVMKTEQQVKEKAEITKKRMHLLHQAREGNQSAIDNLTLSDMDTYSMLSRRVNRNKEDILSIVESSFIPYGIESDQYVIIGEIEAFRRTNNQRSGETVWILSLICNDLNFDILINARDLYGEPAIGRRFRGRVQMQGFLNFANE